MRVRKIAIVGSGIVGLIAAHALRRHRYDVTLYSDRTPDQWLHESRPTGTAARFEMALSYERELGLNHWDAVAPRGEGVFLTFCPKLHNQLIRLIGRSARPFQAVDLRLQCHRWMNDFDGRIVIENVSVARSTYTEPQRKLAMIITTGGAMSFDRCPFTPVKFEFLGTDGEAFFVPYFHKDHAPAWNILFEPKPGSRMDRFTNAKSGDEALSIAKQVVHELFPWDEEWMRPMRLADPNGWLTGSVTPAVRKPVATLSSGRIAMSLGDTAISYDPIAAQGANSGVKQARHVVEQIVARGGEPFDAQWMTSTFDAYFDEHARFAADFTNLFLEPIPPPAKELLIAQFGSDGRANNDSGPQRIADAFFANFNDPRALTGALHDMPRMPPFIAP